MTHFAPSNAAELAATVAWAAAESQSLEIVAGGSKRGFGRPMQAAHTLDIGAIRGVVDYDPGELVLTARAATPMAEIGALLAEQRQMLAFEPPDWSGLLDAAPGRQTLGGVIASNLAGPRRVRAGAARDHFLGFAAVNGWGDAWKAGGTVVKNVTGYDLCKLQAGAHGTLSVLTDISVRVLPLPESSCSLLLGGLSDAEAIRTLSRALNTPHEVSGACHLPQAVAARSGVAEVAGLGGSVTALRLEGPAPSVAARVSALEALLGGGVRLPAAGSAALWSEVAAVQPLLGSTSSVVWRVCTAPAGAPALLARLRGTWPQAEAFYDWGGGLLWLALEAPGDDGGAAALRGAIAGGHATLVRASEALRRSVAVFEPEAALLAALSRRVKDSFDPRRILNPGRMWMGI